MSENLKSIIKANHKGIKFKAKYHAEKSTIVDFPYKGVNIEIKPSSFGVFVFRLINFKLLGFKEFDKKSLHAFLKAKLEKKEHPNVKFLVRGDHVYVYPFPSRNAFNDKECATVFNYAIKEFQLNINSIEKAIQQYLKSDN